MILGACRRRPTPPTWPSTCRATVAVARGRRRRRTLSRRRRQRRAHHSGTRPLRPAISRRRPANTAGRRNRRRRRRSAPLHRARVPLQSTYLTLRRRPPLISRASRCARAAPPPSPRPPPSTPGAPTPARDRAANGVGERLVREAPVGRRRPPARRRRRRWRGGGGVVASSGGPPRAPPPKAPPPPAAPPARRARRGAVALGEARERRRLGGHLHEELGERLAQRLRLRRDKLEELEVAHERFLARCVRSCTSASAKRSAGSACRRELREAGEDVLAREREVARRERVRLLHHGGNARAFGAARPCSLQKASAP